MAIALWIVLLVCVVWIALSEMPVGWDGHQPLPYLIALAPLLWIPTLAIAVAGIATHDTALAVVASIACIASLLRKIAYWNNNLTSINTAQMVADKLAEKRGTSRETHVSTAVEAAKHGRFRVMTLNCRFGRANAAAIVSAVKERDIAVLALQELTDDLVAALDEAGLSDLLPYRQLGENKDTDNGGFNGVWIRVEPSDTSPVTVEIPAADVPGVCFPIDSMRGITFVSAHPKSPMRGCRDWSAGIIGLGELATSQKKGDITVILGDLNSGTDHPSFRGLLAAGFKDAALDEAKGRRATFPSWIPWPRLILDHVLFTAGLDASDVRSFTVNGTDHLALAATLTLK
ncbi:endonuclease/exonuclease/phosphatase family protein [Bifidobacterium ruminantium]|uniref:endonuclease/exonuclease/phosphatase family protein n=1 Tax=Bifidobacterium ruminantium TaxID=78346 RepID=UPI00255C44DC|nr:endonuclease/exonuclease/phosphatase family protein [Bifidobacterium ruminantium]